MEAFRSRLDALNDANGAGGESRRWLFVPYDQLSDGLGPLAEAAPGELGIVLVESRAKAARRPYHRQKLALVLANLRHFALEQAERGVLVRHVATRGGYAEALEPLLEELGPLELLEPAERELRAELAPLVERGSLSVLDHDGWLTTTEQFESGAGAEPPWRMDRFYRRVRQDSGLLMEADKPVGGKYSFDAENRLPWRAREDDPPAPEPPRFTPDEVTREVGELIERDFARHPGRLDLGALPATRADAERLWAFALEECLPWFGPYEDAMSTHSRTLFHTRISGLLNLHRLLPRRVVEDVAATDRERVPLASAEGFIRQVLGWREFVRHVHVATDGFRALEELDAPGEGPGDGGWSGWSGEAWASPAHASAEAGSGVDGGARPNHLAAREALPAAFWGAPSGLNCLDTVVGALWEDGYSHHIPRLMVLSNLATLIGVDPRALADWFWVAYTDAYDWVVEPNVLGMGTFATGPLMTTKPYVSGAPYIDRMSDYCGGCRFHPKRDCPVTPLYWSFLARQRDRLADNHRVRMPLRSLAKRKREAVERDEAVLGVVRERLGAGQELRPEDIPE